MIKVGVAMSKAAITMYFEVETSTFETCCRKNSAQNWPLYQTTPSPITTILAINTYLMLRLRKASFHGFVVIWALAFSSWKIGVSCNFSRIQIAIATSRKDTRNGMRHAQALNGCSP